MRPFFYIANWKMNQSLAQAEDFVKELNNDAIFTSLPAKTKIVLCPSFPHINLVAQALKTTTYATGAQTCSPYSSGAYTGQVAANMLAEVGCTYCIIGHSERRACGETNEQIAKEYNQLVNNALTPIICIGETEKDYNAGATLTTIERQLVPLIQEYQENPATTLLIAYEPVWAIGTGKTPTEAELETVFLWLKNRIKNDFSTETTFLVYGGSVDESQSKIIKSIPHLDGLLIGSASLIFKKFKNIVV